MAQSMFVEGNWRELKQSFGFSFPLHYKSPTLTLFAHVDLGEHRRKRRFCALSPAPSPILAGLPALCPAPQLPAPSSQCRDTAGGGCPAQDAKLVQREEFGEEEEGHAGLCCWGLVLAARLLQRLLVTTQRKTSILRS